MTEQTADREVYLIVRIDGRPYDRDDLDPTSAFASARQVGEVVREERGR